jgi:outer membrane protein TolC
VAARTAAVAEAQTRGRQERVRPWLPTVSVGYSYGGFGGNALANDFGPLHNRAEFDATAVWTVQNLGFGNRARVRAAEATVGGALAAYDLAVNRVRGEVAEAVAAARAAAAQIKTAQEALAAAEEGFELERRRIRQGQWRPIEVLDSFRQLVESRQEMVRAIVAFDVAQFRLFVAVGNTPAP